VLIVAATEGELALLEGAETLVCGIGPVEAAARTAHAIAEHRPSAVLHVGVAGSRTLAPLTVVLGSESDYCDLSAAIPVVDRARPDPALLERCRAALPDVAVVPIGTSAAVGGASHDVEAMEGFGVLRACELAGVPAVELRVVANSPDESDREKWQIDEALGVLADAVARILEG
jgi:predicted 5'-methylthioadenosine/S-adenosylhomocysteine nucleosidase